MPKGEAGRKLGDDDKYNAAATRVMKKHGVEINDLNALTDSFGPELFVKPVMCTLQIRGFKEARGGSGCKDFTSPQLMAESSTF